MDIYDSRFFSINKNLLIVLGLWPYDTRRKQYIRVIYGFAVAAAVVPQIISLCKNYSDSDRFMENLIYSLMGFCCFLKMLTLIFNQKKLWVMFDDIAQNWKQIVDEEEKQILQKYSENGRRLTIAWFLLFAIADFCFIFGPLILVVMNVIKEKSGSTSYLYILNGEYFTEDKNANYLIIYCWDTFSILVVSHIFVATDTTFIICIEHCLGLFAIVRHRVKKLDSINQLVNDEKQDSKIISYDWIVETIKLHQKTIQFSELLGASYSTCFLFILGYTVSTIPLCCILIAVNLKNLIQVIRFAGVFFSLAIHLLNFCWPGQKLINLSTTLVNEIYSNEWHTQSLNSKKALLFLMLRCSKPCKINAGGIFVMNFENFLLIMKTVVSYIMVIGSLRKVEII